MVNVYTQLILPDNRRKAGPQGLNIRRLEAGVRGNRIERGYMATRRVVKGMRSVPYEDGNGVGDFVVMGLKGSPDTGYALEFFAPAFKEVLIVQ